MKPFHLPSFCILGHPIKSAQFLLFLFALEDNSLEVSCGHLLPVEGVDRKINLIMDLSTQLSLQCEKITQMEEVLEENERKIQQLEAERGGLSFARGQGPSRMFTRSPSFL